MHTITSYSSGDEVSIHYNSDFSGNVEIVKAADSNTDAESLLIPGEVLIDFMASVVLGNSHFGQSVRVAIAASLSDK